MEEYGTRLHIPFDFKHFALFLRNPSVCGRVFVYLRDNKTESKHINIKYRDEQRRHQGAPECTAQRDEK